MPNRRSVNTLTLLIAAFLSLSQLQAQDDSLRHLDPLTFKNPPSADRPHAWWHFIDNHISYDGITKDLEAMKNQGINGVTLLNVNRFDGKFGNANVKFNSKEWYEMFRFVLQETKRLKMEVGVQNCDGWSTSGGPWITPETSMKQYAWRKSFVSGGKHVHTKLDRPVGNSNFYKDAFVVAYQSEKPNSFNLAQPSIILDGKNNGQSLADGYPSSNVNLKIGEPVIIKFSTPFTAEVLLAHTQRTHSRKGTRQTTTFTIEASEDGVTYRKVGQVADSIVNETFLMSFPKTTARYFKISIKDILNNGTEKTMRLGELALLKDGERGLYQSLISAHQAKTVAVTADSMDDFYQPGIRSYKHLQAGNGIIKSSSAIIDVTRFMDQEGVLSWDAPKGDWTIIRFGYTTTGKKIHPATKEGEGLECDKMDTTALNLHFKSYPQKLITTAASVPGNTFKYLLVDSWEALYQNWTGNFAQEFENRRGYSLIPYIPVLCGEVVGSPEGSEAFLHDFRKTIADLIEVNFFKHMADLCHRNGLKFHGESIYGGVKYPPLDILKSYSYMDVPMTEFWAPLNVIDTPFKYNPKTKITSTLASHASFLYNKPIVASESYTGFVMYSDSPWDIKLYGDNALSEGVNRLVFHSYVHQPTEKKPGITLGMYGLTFNRHNTWWQYSGSFFQQQARLQHVLQKGSTISDVLVYVGDKYPYQESEEKTAMLLPGIRYNYCNADVLYNRISVRNNKLLLDNKFEFQFLWVKDTLLNLATLQKMEQLVNQGAVIIAPRPVRTLSLKNSQAENRMFQAIVAKLWGKINGKSITENIYGKGKVISGKKPEEILSKGLFTPDLQLKGAKLQDLMFIHKQLENDDAYYLVNKSNKPLQFDAIFRVTAKRPAVWDPVDGQTSEQALFADNGKTTTLPLFLRPRQSVFVIFKKSSPATSFVKLLDEKGVQLFPGISGQSSKIPQLFLDSKGNVTARSEKGGVYTVISGDGKNLNFSLKEPGKMTLTTAKGTVTLQDKKSVTQFNIVDFSPLSHSQNPAVRYYSGVVTYEFDFNVPQDFVKPGQTIYMQLDQFGSTADINLNGNQLATIWEPGYQCDITSAVKPGTNKVSIKVTNPWRNRLVGDMIQSRGDQSTWTSAPFQDKTRDDVLNKGSMLLNSGISKPIKIYSVNNTSIAF